MNYLVIEGNIGVGKTTLAGMLSEDVSGKLILEKFQDNPFLPKFYQNPERYSFPLELSFLADRYRQHKEEIMNRDMFTPLMIADYYFSKSFIFASITLTEDEFRLYRQLYNIILQQQLPVPDLYVYLYLPVDQLLLNIKKRGRDYEKAIQADYLKKLQDGYFNFMKSRKDMKFLILDIQNIDFIHKHDDYKKIKNIIFDEHFKNGICNIIV